MTYYLNSRKADKAAQNDALPAVTVQLLDNPIRVVNYNGEPWFVLVDVCNVVGYPYLYNIKKRLGPSHFAHSHITSENGRTTYVNIVNSTGLHRIYKLYDSNHIAYFRQWFKTFVREHESKSKSDEHMSANKSIYFYGNKKIRTVIKNGQVWWVAKDVCDVLEVADHKQSTRHLNEDEKGVFNIHTPGGKQTVSVINEPGLYSLILRSRKKDAKKFKRWVTHEVLPEIRRSGAYISNDYKKILMAEPKMDIYKEKIRLLETRLAESKNRSKQENEVYIELYNQIITMNGRLSELGRQITSFKELARYTDTDEYKELLDRVKATHEVVVSSAQKAYRVFETVRPWR